MDLTNVEELTPQQRVDNGFTVLDEHGPADWRSRIPETMDTGDPDNCPLFHVFGKSTYSYTEGIRALQTATVIMDDDSTARYHFGWRHGFSASPFVDDYNVDMAEVTAAWKARLFPPATTTTA